MKRICFVTTIPATMRAFVLPAAQYLYFEGGYEVTLVCDGDEEFAASLPEHMRYLPVRMARGISLSGFSAMPRMLRIFREGKFDIVQYSTPNAACYASIAAWLARVPVRLYCQWGIAYVGFSGVKRAVFKALERLVCRLSTDVEPDSFGNLEFSREQGLYNEKKSRVAGNGSAAGVDLDRFDISKREEWCAKIRFRHSVPETAFVYGFVGRLDKDKGVNELLSAFLSLAEQGRDAYLFIIGPEDKLHTLNAGLYARSLGEPRIVYCGVTDEVEKYYAAMDVFVLPSYREGFGSVVAEAQAMGVPVIVTDIPGPREAMADGETGLLVKKADALSLGAGMRRVYDDAALRAGLSANARGFVAQRYERGALMQAILKDRDALISTRAAENTKQS